MNRAEEILGAHNAVITNDHFVYKSEHHGEDYINKDAVFPNTNDMSELCLLLAEQFKDDNVEVVIGPVAGGIAIAQWMAHHLTRLTGRTVLAVYADKVDGDSMVIKRGFERIVNGRRNLAVEDVLNSGGSARKVVRAAREVGGIVIGVGALVNRGGVTESDVDAEILRVLVNVSMQKFVADKCPFCDAGRPINTNLGHGREFLAKKTATTV